MSNIIRKIYFLWAGLFFFLPLFFLISPVYSEGKRLFIAPVSMINTQIGDSWIASVVQERLFSHAKTYFSSYTVVDSANENEIIALQKKSEGAAFNEETAIEVGQITSANFGIFSTVTRVKKLFLLSINFSDLTTGEALASKASESPRDSSDLCAAAGCAVDLLTIDILEQLGESLSPSQIYTLKYGNDNLPLDERLSQSKKDEEEFNKKISELDKEIAQYKTATDEDSIAKLKTLEAQQRIEEERLRMSQEKSKRLSDEQSQRAEDEKKDAQRSIELTEKRNKMSDAINQKVSQAREAKTRNLDLISQILVLQEKKQALLDIDSTVADRISSLIDAAEKDKESLSEELRARPYKRAQLNADGTPAQKAKDAREKEISQKLAEIDLELSNEIDKINSSVAGQKVDLKRLIDQDTTVLEKDRCASTFTGDAKVSFSPFDATDGGWDVAIFIYSNEKSLLSYHLNLKFSDMVRANKNFHTEEENFDLYNDDVELCDSLFLRGEPLLKWEAYYHVSAREFEHATEWTIFLTKVVVTDTVTKKVVLEDFTGTTGKIRMEHEGDFRSDKEIAQDKDIAARRERQKARDLKVEEKKRRTEIKKRVDSWAYHTRGGGSRSGISLAAGFSQGVGDGFALNGDVILAITSHFYLDATFGTKKTPDYYYTDWPSNASYESYDFTNIYSLGVNERVHLGNFHPNLFLQLGIGYDVSWGSYDDSNGYESISGSRIEKYTFVTRGSVGADFPVTSYFSFNFTYSLDYDLDIGLYDIYTFGIIFTLPTFKFVN